MNVLVVTDSDLTFAKVDAALADDRVNVMRVSSGRDAALATTKLDPVLVFCDSQTGTMGGFAALRLLRQESGGRRLEDRRIVLLLDRQVDQWLAKEFEADGTIVKPLNPGVLREQLSLAMEQGAAGRRVTAASPGQHNQD